MRLAEKYRSEIVLALMLSAFIAVAMMPAIPQNPAYHQFADQRSFLGVANFLNVLSSIVFVLAGLYGLAIIRAGGAGNGMLPLHRMYAVFFIGIFLTGIGSGWYHLAPDNQRLFWDRLPMTIAFMSLFSVILFERVSRSRAVRLFWILIVAGAGSVMYWLYTENLGQGDLRLYVLVQFLPVILIPVILMLYQSEFKGDQYYWLLILSYVLAKLAEFLDTVLFELTFNIVSGHSLKHVISAAGVCCIVIMYKKYRSWI